MKLKTNLSSATKLLRAASHKTKLKVSNSSPEILVITGVVGMLGGLVLACKSTLKAEEIVVAAREKREKIESVVNDPELAKAANKTYTEDDRKKDIFCLYGNTLIQLLKIYGPAIIVETASIISIFSGHKILKKRSMAFAAAYAALDKSYKEYRNRVVDEFGSVVDDHISKGLKLKEIDKPAKDEEGRDMTEKQQVLVRDKKPVSEYARLFDEINSKRWDKSPGYNLTFIKQIQRKANNTLKSRGVGGVLFLNEVYDWLGFERTFEGWDVGWKYDPKNPALNNFVDFGLYNNNSEAVEAFLYGEENSVWLDFNVDGIVRNALPHNLRKRTA